MTITLTREQFEKCRRDLAAQGVSLVGDSGDLDSHGVKAQFVYVAPTLTVTVLQKPFFFTLSYLEGQISSWFASESA